jgi:hypothetical protein
VDELVGGQADAADLLGAVVAVTEGDPAIGDGDPKDIAGQVFENLGAGAGVLAVDDPGNAPYLRRDLLLLGQGIEAIAHLGTEVDGERADEDQECRVSGSHPSMAIWGESAGTHQKVDMRVIEHGPG